MQELTEALGKNSTILAICFLNVVPEKIKETVKDKLLMQEDIRSIASCVDNYINTYLKDEQSLYEIRHSNNDNKIPHDMTNNEIEIKLTIEFLKKELDNQWKINDEQSFEIRKLKNEMPLINSMKNFVLNDRNDSSYERRHRSYSRDRFNSNRRFRRDFSRQRYDNTESICYGHRKFGDQCYKESVHSGVSTMRRTIIGTSITKCSMDTKSAAIIFMQRNAHHGALNTLSQKILERYLQRPSKFTEFCRYQTHKTTLK